MAEDAGQAERLRCDDLVTELLGNMEREVIAMLGDTSLADLINQFAESHQDEDRIV